MNLAIETKDLGKRYGDVKAVEHLSLRVAQGETFAFLGLNGAWKTTTMRMSLGMIKPTTRKALRSSMLLFTTLGSLLLPLGIAFLKFYFKKSQDFTKAWPDQRHS